MFLFTVSFFGCEFWENKNGTSPTSPSVKNPEQFASFYVGRGISDQIGVYKGTEFFQINVPTGDYLLTYTTNLGTFEIVFRATKSALLNIGLQPGDEVQEVSLQKGTIDDTAIEVGRFGPTIVYFQTGCGTAISIGELFIIDTCSSIIILISGGEVIPSDIVIFLPEPEKPDKLDIPGATQTVASIE
jgi:hypothetical protein